MTTIRTLPWRAIGLGVVAVLAVKLLLVVLGETTDLKVETPAAVVVLGLIMGMTYGLLSVGLVLIYRTNGIINFAHGQIGALGAAIFGVIAVMWHFPYWVAFPMALAAAAAVSATAEVAVVRRLRSAPKLMSVVATLGVGQLLTVLAMILSAKTALSGTFPMPPGLPTFDIGALHVTQAYSGMLFLCPLLVVGIAVFLRVSKYGLAMRAASANPDAARMAGIFASRMSGLAWAIAGVLSAFTAILTQAASGFTAGDSFGPDLLLRALTGAVIAKMSSLPRALIAGLGIGVFEQVLLWNYPTSGLLQVGLFVAILVACLLQRAVAGRDEDKSSWASVQVLAPIPPALRAIPLVRHLRAIVVLAAAAVAVLLPLVVSNSDAVRLTSIVAFAVIGLSVATLTGLAGQLTLGQAAVGSIGAVVSYWVATHTGNFPLALLYGGLVAGLVSVLIGIPALRVRGLILTVTTLAFALAIPSFLLTKLIGAGVQPGQPILPGGHALDTGKSYYYFALAVFGIALLIAHNVRRSGFGRLMVAVRDNEANARAFTVRSSLVKLQGYLLSGFLAGIGGATFGHSLSAISSSTFPATASIDVVVMTVIGGVSILSGPLLGALLVIGLPAFVPLGSLGLAATYVGQLAIILYLPGGLGSLVEKIRDRIVRWAAARAGVDYDAAYAAEASETGASVRVVSPAPRARRAVRHTLPPVILEARDLRKSFGGVHAVDGVSFAVREGETVGLIGPNGAGKTTTFELLGGFTRPDSGRVLFQGEDVTALSPEARARLGLIRSFQDAALFPTMTVTESVMLGLERVRPTSFLTSLAGLSGPERSKERAARELVAWMGLERYRNKQIRELSTGTRRITELACLVALEPTFLLLDEPASGVAQRETEALGGLLDRLKRDLGLTLLVIEHDIPLVTSISDRIVAMADGRVLAEGTPAEVMADPRVAEAYLGGDMRTIERSDRREPSLVS